MKIAVTAPVYVTNQEHRRYLDLTTKSIVSERHSIVWIPCENYVNPAFEPLTYVFDEKPLETRILHPTGEQSISKAWNLGIEDAKNAGCDYVLVINTDIVFKHNAIDRLVDFAVAHPEAVMWTGTECDDLVTLESCKESEKITYNPHYSCFMVKTDFFENAGKFDENFTPSYCEDVDMYTRLLFSGKKSFKYGGALFYHFGSTTIKSDKNLLRNNAKTYSRCQLYFLQKWGSPQIEDTERIKKDYFAHPYGEDDKPLSYWRQPKKSGRFWSVLPIRARCWSVQVQNWFKKRRII